MEDYKGHFGSSIPLLIELANTPNCNVSMEKYHCKEDNLIMIKVFFRRKTILSHNNVTMVCDCNIGKKEMAM